MAIDLAKVIGYSKDCLQSRALMRAVMLDLYPGQTREMNVLLDIYESGIPREIRNAGTINDSQYAAYVRRIMDEYGLQECYVRAGLDAWINQSIAPGAAEGIKKPSVDFNQTGGATIAHKPIRETPIKDVSGSTADFEIKQSVYDADKIEIVKFLGFDESELVVPNEIDGKKVICIGKGAYKDCRSVEKVIVSHGIEYIEDSAFYGCTSLSSVVLPATLKKIGSFINKIGYAPAGHSGAFASTALESIDLPLSLTYLGESTFFNCQKLKNISFPMTLTYIGANAFHNCARLKRINMPNGITCIYAKTFRGCNSLKEIELPDDLIELQEEAFYGSGLERISFPEKTKVIGNAAFMKCASLVDVRLNEGLEKIRRFAFQDCTSLERIVIPSTVQEFGDGIFTISIYRSTLERLKYRNLVIYCYAGTKAIEYARAAGYPVENAAKLNS